MNNAPQVKGWCPGALSPMMSGDGLVVRVRPFNGRLRRAQADGLATLAAAHGNGLLDLSSRCNIQLRGVSAASHPAILEGLSRMGLLDPNAAIEARRNVMVTPFWQTGDETEALVTALSDALASGDAPEIPNKFGFAVDTGRAPVLQNASADVRLERSADGDLILVAEGSDTGKPVTRQTAVTEALALAQWFLASRSDERRMSALLANGKPVPSGHNVKRQSQTYVPVPGPTPLGALVGFAFGQLQVQTLSSLAKHGGLRMTPWRMVLVESAQELPDIDGLITDAADPLLRVVACTGAPRCPQGFIETRPLARALSARIPMGELCHVSGCAKGCAHPKIAQLTVTGRPDGLSLIRNGSADDLPAQTGLSLSDIIKAI
ncbi:MAG: precorrin-3B synthase [Sulfitobacter sp.]